MKGIVSAGHELTAAAAVEMLEEGGNAFDAAVAATLASFVTESALTSPGGGGFLLARVAGPGRGEAAVKLYDFFTDVPGLGRTEKKVRNFFSLFVDFPSARQELHIGEGSAAVPGTMAGLSEVCKNHCTLPLKTLFAPAIRYARDGIALNEQQASFNRILAPILTICAESRGIYMPEGRFLEQGDTIRNRAMADTFEHLAEEGIERFYDGDVAEKVLEVFAQEGMITPEDLAGYRVRVREPLETSYRGRKIYTNPPPSSGGPLIAFSLRLLEAFDVASLGHNTTRYLRLLADVMRATNEARKAEFDHRIHEPGISGEFLSESVVRGYVEKIRLGLQDPSGQGPRGSEPGSTTQISVLDSAGNAASVTTSTGIGCGFMVPGTGIMMNNMLGERDLNPLGYHAMEPGTRMSSMMAPTMVVKDSMPELVLGSGGSKRIRSAILQVIVNVLDHGLPIHEAVNAPRVHWERGIFDFEHGFDEGVVRPLEELGYNIKRWPDRHMYFGGVHTVTTKPGGFSGAGDTRRGGVVMESS